MKKQNKYFVESYLENCRQLNKSHHTITNYFADLKKFIKWYENTQPKPLIKINGNTITLYKDFLTYGGDVFIKQSFKNKMRTFFRKMFRQNIEPKQLAFKQTPLAVGSRRRHLSAVKNFFEFLKQTHEDRGKIFLINPVKSKIHAIKLKEQDVINTKMIDGNSWNKLIEAQWRVRDRLLLHLLYYAGMRLSEVCDLKVLDFDEESKTIKFIRKGGYVHTLRSQKSEQIFSMLNGYLISREIMSDYVFPNSTGKRISNRSMHNQIKVMIQKGELPQENAHEITPHSFRKACATNLYLKNKDLLMVRDYLNHKDAKVTQTYIDKRTLEAINKIMY